MFYSAICTMTSENSEIKVSQKLNRYRYVVKFLWDLIPKHKFARFFSVFYLFKLYFLFWKRKNRTNFRSFQKRCISKIIGRMQIGCTKNVNVNFCDESLFILCGPLFNFTHYKVSKNTCTKKTTKRLLKILFVLFSLSFVEK